MSDIRPNEGTPVTPERLNMLTWGYAPPLMLEAAVKLRVFDVLDLGPKTLEELADATGASERGLRALANALVGLQFLAKNAEGRYSLTPESSAFLVSGKPGFRGGILRHASTQLIPAWLHLTDIVRDGRPISGVNREAEGSAFFSEFVEALFDFNYLGAVALAENLGTAELTAPYSALDLAAGSGVWGIALAQKSPHVRVTAVDWPRVVPVTERIAARCGVGDRLECVAGDLLAADFGNGHDLAVLGHILHSEGEVRSRQLLKKTYDALRPGGRIAIAEMLPDHDRSGPPHALIFAVNMLVNTDEGDTYSFEEIGGWLAEAGFISPELLPIPGPSPLILATKPA